MTTSKNSYLWSPLEVTLPALPVRRLQGRRPGPRILVTGGIHGDEYEGPVALHEWFEELDPELLSGDLVLLPVVNVAAWRARARRTPVDDVDLNRVFPGRGNGSPTQRLAASVWAEFVQPADVVIDLHSGGQALIHHPLAGSYAGATPLAEQLRAAFGPPFLPWVVPDAPGVFSREAHVAGKVAFGLEWGGGGVLDQTGVREIKKGLHRCLSVLKMLEVGGTDVATETKGSEPPVRGDYFLAAECGVFEPLLPLGSKVRDGECLGRLVDPLSGRSTAVNSPWPGTLAGLSTSRWVEVGERIAYVG